MIFWDHSAVNGCKRGCLGGSIVILIFMVAVEILLFAASDVTKYCPMSHHFGLYAFCEVLDQTGGRVLVRHGQFDEYYLEIIEPSGARARFELPDAARSGSEAPVIRFIPGFESRFMVNGRQVELEALP